MRRALPSLPILAIVLLLRAAAPAAAAEAAAWTVGVAAFDTSALAAAERLAGELVHAKLAAALFSVALRRLPDPEREAFRRRLSAEALGAAVAELAAKRSARDALLFGGLADWKYRAELRKADDAAAAARKTLDAAAAAVPEPPREKTVKAAKENAGGAFFPAPKRGEERSFCVGRAYDALLLGRVEPFYGRISVSVRLYSPNLNGDLYADETTFSPLDREAALRGLEERLAAAVSGTAPASVAVAAEPADAVVRLDGEAVGTGTLTRTPGKARLTAEAPARERLEAEVELAGGSLNAIAIELPPSRLRSLAVEAFGGPDGPGEAAVSLDGLFVGRTPFELSLEEGRAAYLRAEAADGRTAEAVARSGETEKAALRLVVPPPKDARPTEDARRAFYGAFGRFSIFLSLSFIVSGTAFSYENASIVYNSASLAELSARAELASAVLWTAAGAFAAESVFRFVKYLKNSGARAIGTVAAGKP